MKKYFKSCILLIVVLLSCGGGGSNNPGLEADSVPLTTYLSSQDSLQNILNQMLADTNTFSKFPCQDKYGNNATVWYKDSSICLVRMHRKPNDEGVEETGPDYLFFDETGMFSAFQVSYGLRYVSRDSVYVWKSSGFYKEAIYGRGISWEKVNPVLEDYKYQSLRFLEIYTRTGINYHFSLLSFYTDFECQAINNVKAYTETNRNSKSVTLEPGQLPFHYISATKDIDGFHWIEIRMPTPDPIDDERLYVPSDKFFDNVSYDEY